MKTILSILLFMGTWILLDAQPEVVKYPAGNIAYKKEKGIVTFYNAQEKPIRVIDLHKKTDIDLLKQEKDYLYTSIKNTSQNGSGCRVEIKYNNLGLKIKESWFGCSSDGKDEAWDYNYNKYGAKENSNCAYDAWGNIVKMQGGTNYYIFGNITLLLDNLGNETKNLYDQQHFLVKQLHFENNKQRATSYAQYDAQHRLSERFTYDRVLKCITNYQAFYYSSDTAVVPTLLIKYDPHWAEGRLWLEQKDWTDISESRTNYNLSIAAEPLVKMAVQDFRALVSKTKKEFDKKKPQYLDKWHFTVKEKYMVTEYYYEHFYSPNSESRTIFKYDDKGRRVRQTNLDKKGKIVDDYI